MLETRGRREVCHCFSRTVKSQFGSFSRVLSPHRERSLFNGEKAFNASRRAAGVGLSVLSRIRRRGRGQFHLGTSKLLPGTSRRRAPNWLHGRLAKGSCPRPLETWTGDPCGRRAVAEGGRAASLSADAQKGCLWAPLRFLGSFRYHCSIHGTSTPASRQRSIAASYTLISFNRAQS